jgi:WD40 repeat protein
VEHTGSLGLCGHVAALTCLSCGPQVWDGESGCRLQRLMVAEEWVTCLLAFQLQLPGCEGSPPHPHPPPLPVWEWRLACGYSDSSVCIWDPASGCLLHTLDEHEEPVTCLHLTEWNGRRTLASADEGGRVLTWDLGQPPETDRGPGGNTTRAANKRGSLYHHQQQQQQGVPVPGG